MTPISFPWTKPEERPRARLVLASASPRRLQLLGQIGLVPDEVAPVDCDETPWPREMPRALATRLARTKAELAAERSPAGESERRFILAADTVVAVGRRILPKAESREEALRCLDLLSGRGHRVFTAIALVAPDGRLRARLVETRVKFKRLSPADRSHYLASGEWAGKAGAYAIQGVAGAFVVQIVGSYSAVVGLPLHETRNLLEGEGFPVRGASPPVEAAPDA